MSAANFTIQDSTAAQEILALVGGGAPGTGTDTGGTGTDPGDTGTDTGDPDAGTGDPGTGSGGTDVTSEHGTADVTASTATVAIVLDFGSLSAKGVHISEADGDLLIEVVGNGGHTYVIENVQAEDITLANLAAPTWNDGVLDDHGGVVDQLIALGYDDIA